MRTATPAESWHDLVFDYHARVVWREVDGQFRFFASVFKGKQRNVGRTVFGSYATVIEAVNAAQLMVNCWIDDDGERLADRWERAELAKGRQ